MRPFGNIPCSDIGQEERSQVKGKKSNIWHYRKPQRESYSYGHRNLTILKIRLGTMKDRESKLQV